MSIQIELDIQQLSAFCKRWQVSKLALFGLVLRADFRPDSDVDILIDFHGNLPYTFRHWFTMEEELTELLWREVDLIDWKAIESSPNAIRRTHIWESAQVIYATNPVTILAYL